MQDANDAPGAPETDENDSDVVDTPEAADATPEANTDTFSREYVEQLRTEAKDNRKRAEAAEKRLHTELVRATGRLQDIRDLPFDQSHLESDAVLAAAIDALLEERPHLKARTITGDVGQGNRGKADEPFSLLKALKGL